MLTAENADVFALYVESVQSPSEEVSFISRVFRKHYGRRPHALREDFCGSAALCAAWVKSDARRTALGVDGTMDVIGRSPPDPNRRQWVQA